MSAGGGRRPGEDELLERRLRAALQAELDATPVDVAGLLRATRRAAPRARARRAALVAVATAAVVAVPLGVQLVQSDRPVIGPPAAGGGAPVPSSTAAGPGTSSAPGITPPTPTSTPPATPTFSSDDPDEVAFRVPDDVAFSRDDLGADLPADDQGHHRRGPTVAGQACGGTTPERWPLTRRTWNWSGSSSRVPAVDLVVTAWRDSLTAFDTVRWNAGRCRFGARPRISRDDEDVWLAGDVDDGLARGYAVRRLPGQVVVAVSVIHPDGVDAATSEAQRLAIVAEARWSRYGVATLP